jgi:CMP-N,N'-diacetyllegionaminic acid synthase
MSEAMLCVIPARGGSKRLPRKNLRALKGKPLIAYTIEVARESRLFENVYVCTDDKEIGDVAVACGASVPVLMPAELCGDLVASHVPCQHLAAHLAAAGDRCEILVCLQPTSPLRSVADLKTAAQKFRGGNFESLVSVTPLDPHDFHWAVTPNGNDYWRMYFANAYMKERPLLPPVFRPNGSIKIADLSALARTGHFFGERMGVIETPPERSVHVAIEFDLTLCELILRNRT